MEYDDEYQDDYQEEAAYDEEYYDEEEGEESEAGEPAAEYSVKSISDKKKGKSGALYFVNWSGNGGSSWETKETIVEYGGAVILKQFEAEREKQQEKIKQEQRHQQIAKAGLNAKERQRERLEEEKARRAAEAQAAAQAAPFLGVGAYAAPEAAEPEHWPDLRETLRSEPPAPSFDLTPLAEVAAAPIAESADQTTQATKGRVRTLRTLAVTAFSKAVLLYEELGEFPTSLKAPVFAMLMKSYELSAAHLKVLLSNDQKKLDFSVAPHIMTSEHVLAVAERCRELEHLDLHNCQDIVAPSGISLQPAQTMSALAAGCPNLTFLDVSYVHLVRNLSDIVHSCRHLRILRAVNADLVENGLLSSEDLIQPHLEELDVSMNLNLDPMQPLSRLFPGCCPKLRVLRLNAVGLDHGDINDRFSQHLDHARARAEARSETSAGASAQAKPNLRELRMNLILRQANKPWLCNFELLNAILSCIDKRESLETFELGLQEVPVIQMLDEIASVFRTYLCTAATLTPGLKTLIMQNLRGSARQYMPELWGNGIVLPVSLSHLDWARTEFPYRLIKHILFPDRFSSNVELPVPRLRYFDLSDKDNRQSLDPVVFVELMRNTYHPFETLNLQGFGCFSYETGWDSRFNKDVLSSFSFEEVRLAPQPLLTKLDLSHTRWLTDNHLKRIVNVNVMPNLKELAFAQGWAIRAKQVEQFLKHPELPPKLTKLTLTDRKVDDVTIFSTPDLEIPQITHVISNRALQFPDSVRNLIRVFKHLEILELHGSNGSTGSAMWEEIASPHSTNSLKEVRLRCTPAPNFRVAFGSLKKSNQVRTFYISGCIDSHFKEQENAERKNLEMLVGRGQMTQEDLEDEMYIYGKHRLTVHVEACPCNRSTHVFPSYFV